MSRIPSGRAVAHGSFFFLIAASKTLVNVGQACLTVDATILALNCLAQYHRKSIDYDDDVHAVNILSQTTAAIFSTLIVMLTRYKPIWDKLDLEKLRKKFEELQEAVAGCSKKRKATLIFIGLFGLLSCVARGLSAYLGVEVILGDRSGANSTSVILVGGVAALTVTIQSMCFNLSNMLTDAAELLKKSSIVEHLKKQSRPSVIVSMIATVSTAVAMRFFILHFLDRRHTSVGGQITGQIVFTVSEFVMGLFTMVSSFDEDWQGKAKKTLTHAWPLTFMIVGDAVASWLGYSTIAWYSILTDTFLDQNIAPDFIGTCVSNPSSSDFSARWAFMGLACMIGVPTTLAYLHYLLDYAKTSYDIVKDSIKPVYTRCRYGIFDQGENIPLTSGTLTPVNSGYSV